MNAMTCHVRAMHNMHNLRERSVKIRGSSSQYNVCYVLIHTQRGLGLLCPILPLFIENRVPSVTSSTGYGYSIGIFIA